MHFTKRFWLKSLLPVRRRILIAPEWMSVSGVLPLCEHIDVHLDSVNAETFKDDAAAKVAAIDFDGTNVIVKKYNSKTVVKFLTRGIRKSIARKSWNNAHHLIENGIDTIKPIALVEDSISFFKVRSFFIGTFIAGQDGRFFFNDEDLDSEIRQNVADMIVDSLLFYHSKNIFIGDTKDVNLIIGVEGVFWIDLEELSYAWWQPKKRKMIRDWQVLFYNWKNDFDTQGVFYNSLRKKVDKSSYWHIVRNVALYGGKRFSIKEIQARLSKDFESSNEILSQINMISEGILHSDWIKVGSSRNAIVAYKKFDEHSLYCKVFLHRNKMEGLKRLFRPGRGERSVKSEQMMKAAGFSVPESLYWCSKKGREIVLSKGVEGISMVAWLAQRHGDIKVKRNILTRFGKLVAELHLAGFIHGDLRLGNVIIKHPNDGAQFVFIDNERTRLFRIPPKRLIIQNLRQINTDAVLKLSRTDRLRIFKAYQDVHDIFSREDEKSVIALIEEKTRRRLAASFK